jgi:hypothetical protein
MSRLTDEDRKYIIAVIKIVDALKRKLKDLLDQTDKTDS